MFGIEQWVYWSGRGKAQTGIPRISRDTVHLQLCRWLIGMTSPQLQPKPLSFPDHCLAMNHWSNHWKNHWFSLNHWTTEWTPEHSEHSELNILSCRGDFLVPDSFCEIPKSMYFGVWVPDVCSQHRTANSQYYWKFQVYRNLVFQLQWELQY